MSRRTRLIVLGVAAIVVVVGLLVAPALLLVHRADFPFERAYGDAVVSTVARVFGGDAKNPLGTRVPAAGRYAYTGSCAMCHGAKGDGKGVFGQDAYPPASDLTRAAAKSKTDAELFWITKNGLSFTGMPGFGKQYGDQDLWAIVSYIRALQQGRGSALNIPAPTEAELAVADPRGNAVSRGAAAYFAQGCHLCHGAVGHAPGDLSVHEGDAETIRRGKAGMPAYGTDRLSAAELTDLLAYMRTFTGD
jgi:mono/diheme cytochrome c family protein